MAPCRHLRRMLFLCTPSYLCLLLHGIGLLCAATRLQLLPCVTLLRNLLLLLFVALHCIGLLCAATRL